MRIGPRPGTLIVPKPEGMSRVETGPVQFGEDDWPGVFFRGDNALQYANVIDHVIVTLRTGRDDGLKDLLLVQLDGMVSDLRSCSVGNTGWPPTPDIKADLYDADHKRGQLLEQPDKKAPGEPGAGGG